MAGIVKSTKRRYSIGKQIKEVQVPGTELDTDVFFADLQALGANRSPGTMTTEFAALPSIVKNEGVFALVRQGYKTGFIYAMNGDTKSVEIFNFERNSSATKFQNSSLSLDAANVPRIDTLAQYEGRGAPGYLFEKASSNLMPYSGLGNYGSFEAIYSSDRSRCSVVTELGRTCVKVIGDNPVFRFTGVSVEMKTYTYSFWIKAASPFTLRLSNYSGGSYNSETHSVTTSWQRITKTFVPREGATADILHFYQTGTGNMPDVFIAEFQLEEGSVATSYIPTTNAIGVRLADKLTSQRPIAVYPRNSFYMDSDFYKGWFGDGVKGLKQELVGVNFVRRTSPEWSGWISSEGGFNQSTTIFNGAYIEGIYYSDFVTVSFEIEYRNLEFVSGGTPGLYINYQGNVSGWNAFLPVVNITSAIATETTSGVSNFTTTVRITNEGIPLDDTCTIRIRRDYVRGDIRLKKFKIERGQTATPWSPAPEDIVQIDASGNLKIESNASHNIRSLSLVPRALTQEEVQ